MIKLFNLTDTSFVSNGDKIIIPTKAKIHIFLDVEAIKKYEVA